MQRSVIVRLQRVVGSMCTYIGSRLNGCRRVHLTPIGMVMLRGPVGTQSASALGRVSEIRAKTHENGTGAQAYFDSARRVSHDPLPRPLRREHVAVRKSERVPYDVKKWPKSRSYVNLLSFEQNLRKRHHLFA
jgi:hypothetical protein